MKTKKTGWSPERRAAHSKNIQKWKPWLKSTGPKTDEGKAQAAQNALKHGYYHAHSYEMRALFRCATQQRAQIEALIMFSYRIQHERLRCLQKTKNRGTNYWTSRPSGCYQGGLFA